MPIRSSVETTSAARSRLTSANRATSLIVRGPSRRRRAPMIRPCAPGTSASTEFESTAICGEYPTCVGSRRRTGPAHECSPRRALEHWSCSVLRFGGGLDDGFEVDLSDVVERAGGRDAGLAVSLGHGGGGGEVLLAFLEEDEGVVGVGGAE